MGALAMKVATYADLEHLPEDVNGELIGGVLYAAPRPAVRHNEAGAGLHRDIGHLYGRRRGGSGPGGWIIHYEPELHLGMLRGQSAPNDTVVVPDLAGWRRSRVPRLPDRAAVELRPDWVCEIMSPGRRAHDRIRKLHVYATAGIEWYWLVDPHERTVEVLHLDHDTALYTTVHTHEGAGELRAPPFDAAAFDVGEWWLEDEPSEGDPADGAPEDARPSASPENSK